MGPIRPGHDAKTGAPSPRPSNLIRSTTSEHRSKPGPGSGPWSVNLKRSPPNWLPTRSINRADRAIDWEMGPTKLGLPF
jgi:hypothetical protein